MEYSKDNVMTRKEYLKSKNKRNIDFKIVKRILIVVVILVLSIYLFKQLNVYNEVTKVANAVVEKNALAKTMTMYYVADSYTKDDVKSVMYYKSSDESRIKIPNTENMSNIKLVENTLYGIKSGKLYAIDLDTKQEMLVIDAKVANYIVKSDCIYYIGENGVGLYKYNIHTKKTENLLKDKIQQIDVTDNYIYLIAKGNTKQSVIRVNLDGKNKKVLSEDYVVLYFYLHETGDMFFIHENNSKLYCVDRNGNLKCVLNVPISKPIILCDNQIFYINKKDQKLYKKIIGSDKQELVIDKQVTNIQRDQNTIYYKLKDGIGIYKYDILTKKITQVTSARTSEYICKN